jgi:hypothetical protein
MAKESTFGEIIKWVLIGGAAYFIYNAWASSQSTAAVPPAVSPTPVGTTTGTTTTTTSTGVTTSTPTTVVSGTGTNPAPATTTAQGLTQAAGGQTQLTADEWNYYWGQVSGVPQTTDLFPAGNRDALMSVDAYLAARSAAGLSPTLTGFSGLGAIALPVPLVFAYGADKRPVLVIPRGVAR